jgi:FKBP-type peptidyl-prolyl cis-trans isomerase SlyD
MEISNQCVVALTWTLKDTLGEELDVLDDPVEFLIGGQDLFKTIEEALQGHEKGDKLDLHLEPEQAFGDFNDQLVLYTVSEIYPDHIVLDGNHPLAGIALRLSLKIEGVREATEEEIGAGSAGTGFFRVTPLASDVPGNSTLH